ncbi:MAG: sugar phosphate isomerase/epimerase family protein, partial [Anaerolineae bacterium]
MKLAIASYAFHGLLREGKIDVFGYLESCAYRYHLRAADIWNGMVESTEDDYLAKLKDALDERELELANLCVDGAHIWEDDPDLREEHYQNALAHLHAAEVLNARTIRIDAGGRDETWSEEQFDLIVKRYQEYAQRAYDNGYKVGPENHWGTEVNPDNMVKLCKA